MKKSRLVNLVRYFILIELKVQQRSESSQIFLFNSTEEKQRSDRRKIIRFNSSEVKERSECSR